MSEIGFPDNEEDGIEIAGPGTAEQKILAVAHTRLTTDPTSSKVPTTYFEIL